MGCTEPMMGTTLVDANTHVDVKQLLYRETLRSGICVNSLRHYWKSLGMHYLFVQALQYNNNNPYG